METLGLVPGLPGLFASSDGEVLGLLDVVYKAEALRVCETFSLDLTDMSILLDGEIVGSSARVDTVVP